ncbi:hypothetical protein [uncultured Mediterranean phage uvMED]|nr:hypothetical protein [uncultured Mediterranean phage uvMED]
MAISYENVIYDRVIESLSSIIANEFSIPIKYDAHEGNQSFLITPVSDDLNELLTTAQVRDYTVNVSYQVDLSGNYTKLTLKQVSEIAERVKRLIYNNRNYTASGVRQFNNAVVESIEYSRDEDNPDLVLAILSVNVSVMEVIG